jgi:hypothetical protein
VNLDGGKMNELNAKNIKLYFSTTKKTPTEEEENYSPSAGRYKAATDRLLQKF